MPVLSWRYSWLTRNRKSRKSALRLATDLVIQGPGPLAFVFESARLTPTGEPPAPNRRSTCWGNAVGSTSASTATKFSKRSEEHTSELQSLMRISYAVFCLKTKNTTYSSDHLT